MPLFGLGKPNIEKMKQKRDVKGLCKALSHKDETVRRDATKALGVVALEDTDWNVRQNAVEALGRIGDARAAQPLIATLKDTQAKVRADAVLALGRIGDARAAQPLIATLKNTQAKVHEHAVEALGKIGDAAVEPLIAALKDADVRVRSGAAKALGVIGDVRAVEPLTAALKDVDVVQVFATEALKRLQATPAVCDGCGKNMERGKGYMLRPEQKTKIISATEKGTWPPETTRLLGTAFGLEGSIMKRKYIASVLSDGTTWLLCESCISLLDMTNSELIAARSAAQQWWARR